MCVVLFSSHVFPPIYGDTLSLHRFGETKSALCTDLERDFDGVRLDLDFDRDLDIDLDREREREDFWYGNCEVSLELLAVAGINCGRSVTR